MLCLLPKITVTFPLVAFVLRPSDSRNEKLPILQKKNLLTGKRGVGESSRRATEDSTWLKLEKDHLF